MSIRVGRGAYTTGRPPSPFFIPYQGLYAGRQLLPILLQERSVHDNINLRMTDTWFNGLIISFLLQWVWYRRYGHRKADINSSNRNGNRQYLTSHNPLTWNPEYNNDLWNPTHHWLTRKIIKNWLNWCNGNGHPCSRSFRPDWAQHNCDHLRHHRPSSEEQLACQDRLAEWRYPWLNQRNHRCSTRVYLMIRNGNDQLYLPYGQAMHGNGNDNGWLAGWMDGCSETFN